MKRITTSLTLAALVALGASRIGAQAPAAGAERRRYAGTSHIDVSRVDPAAVRDVLDRHVLEISSLAYYPNNLHPDPAERRAANTHLRKVIDAAAKLDVGIVGTFVGRDQTKNVPDNFREFRKVWPRLVDYAEQRGVKIAIENCPMIFSWDEWPGGTNLASTPAACPAWRGRPLRVAQRPLPSMMMAT